MPLLALLFLGASAAVPSAQHAVGMARTAIDRGDFVQAQGMIEAALAAHGNQDSEAVWTLRVLLGEALISQKNAAAAKAALDFTLPPKYAHAEVAVQQFVQRGYATLIADDRKLAREHVEKAKSLAEKHQPQAQAEVYRALAAVDRDNGLAHAQKAVAFAKKYGRRVMEVKALNSMGFYLAGQRRYVESIETNGQALQAAERYGLKALQQNTQGNLGWAYTELGDYEYARELFETAEATARRIGMRRDHVPWLIQLGALSFLRREYDKARKYNLEALAVDPKHEQAHFAYTNLASAAMEVGQFDHARRHIEQARAAHGDDPSLRILDARMATKNGDLKRAETLLLDVIAKADPKKEASTKWEAEARLAEVYVRGRQNERAAAYFDRAIATATETRTGIAKPDLRFSFFNLVQEILDRYVDFLVAQNRIEDALAVTERSRAESLEEGRELAAKIDAPAIAKKHNATILSYWLGRDQSYLFVVNAREVKLHRLPADTIIEKAVEKQRRVLRSPHGVYERMQTSGAELYALLLRDVSLPKESRVMIVADGALHTLNFETLMPSPGRWWIEDVVVTYAGSLQLLHGRTAAKPPAEPSILLVGNAPTVEQFPALPQAGAEMSAIAKRFRKRTVLEGVKATPAAYRAASPGKFDYVHFAAHGVASQRQPLDSAVILARDATTYKLLARDVAGKPLSARLVTISSCYSAGTRTYAGEGVVGLAWAFQRAGADQVIASLWKVSDAPTSALMDQMYARIQAGRDPADALRDAKLSFVRATGSRRNPRNWAPFVLYAGT